MGKLIPVSYKSNSTLEIGQKDFTKASGKDFQIDSVYCTAFKVVKAMESA